MIDTQTPAPLLGIDPKYLSKAKGQIFTISSEGIIGETHARLDVVVLMKRHLNMPYAILSWQESSGSSKTEDETESEEDNS